MFARVMEAPRRGRNVVREVIVIIGILSNFFAILEIYGHRSSTRLICILRIL
jgi:hypothetical protein